MTAAQFLETAVALAVQTALVITATAGLCRLVPHRSNLQSRLWATAHGALLVLVAAAATLPHLRMTAPWPMPAAQILTLAEAEATIGRGLLIGWLMGASISTTLTLIGWWQSLRCLSQCVAVDLHGLPGLPRPVIDEFRRRRIVMLAGSHVVGPCCWQFHRPHIVLPATMLSFNPPQLTFVLRHELAHLALGHPLQLFLQRLVEAVLWFHPWVWWSSIQAALARELACDDAVIGSRADVAGYLRTLLAVLEQSSTAAAPARETLSFGAGASVTARRARHLMLRAQGTQQQDANNALRDQTTLAALLTCAAMSAAVWAPIDVLQSSRSRWSPWPGWTAAVLSNAGVSVRDYEVYDPHTQLYELRGQSRTP